MMEKSGGPDNSTDNTSVEHKPIKAEENLGNKTSAKNDVQEKAVVLPNADKQNGTIYGRVGYVL